jgi:hypothetical protein
MFENAFVNKKTQLLEVKNEIYGGNIFTPRIRSSSKRGISVTSRESKSKQKY